MLDLDLHYADGELGQLKAEVARLEWRLRDLVLPRISLLAKEYGWTVWVTCVFREDGIHADGRAIDLDILVPGGSPADHDAAGEAMARLLNRHFSGRKWNGSRLLVGYFHENRGTPGYHLHVQVPGRALKVLA